MTDRNVRVQIREELDTDIAAIRELNSRAFGQSLEADIVDALRSHGAVLLSLVATIDERIVGHILYSPASIGDLAGAGLGPMAVLPGFQRRGIGSALVAEGSRRMKQAGWPFVVVLGHAEFYPRFGFTRASAHGISSEWDVPDEVFMLSILDPPRMSGVSGQVRYRPEFATAL